MIIRNTLKAAALASVCLIPLAAAAQDDNGLGFAMPEAAPNTQALTDISNKPAQVFDNEATIGLRGQSSQSAEFGRYNGQYNDGVDVIGSLMMRSSHDWKSADTYYLNLDAKNLSFGAGDHFDISPSSEADLKIGNQGTWGASVNYWSNTYVQSNQFTTLYDTSGGLVNGFTRINGTALTASTNLPFATDTIGLRRDRGTAGLSYILGNWAFDSAYTHEHKEGQIETAVTEGGGSGTFVFVPLPISYDTDTVNLTAKFNAAKLQAILGYRFSNFQDNNSSYNFEAFVTPGTTSVGRSAVANGVLSQAPSNMAHQLSAQVGYNLSPDTRLNANLVYGLEMQNQSYVGSTGNTALQNTVNGFGNPDSLDGFVQTTFANLAMTSQLNPKVNMRASYTVDGRAVNTGDQTIHTINPNNPDIGTTNTATATTAAAEYPTRYSRPESWLKQTATLEAGYRILPSTRVTLGYTFTGMDRTEAITNHTGDNAVSLEVHSTLSNDVNGTVGYSHSIRTASDPDLSVWSNYMRSIYIGTTAGNNVNGYGGDCTPYKCFAVPFYEQSRTRDEVSGRLNVAAGRDVNVGLMAKVAADSYPDSIFGMGRDDQLVAGPDLSYRISDSTDLHMFYTFMHTYRDMTDQPAGLSAATAPTTAAGVYALGHANEATNDNTHTIGLGGTWKASPVWKFGSDYAFSYGAIGITQSGAFAGPGDGAPINGSMPLVTSMMHSFKLHGDYEWAPDVTVRLAYGFDRLISNDWQMWGTTAGESLSGDVNPNYNVHTVMTSVSFKW